jgi:hypothetical protein
VACASFWRDVLYCDLTRMGRHGPQLSSGERRSVAEWSAADKHVSNNIVGLPVIGDTA